MEAAPSASTNAPAEAAELSLEGLGGWLVLLGLGLVVGVIRAALSALEYYTSKETHEAFQRLPIAMEGELTLNSVVFGSLVFAMMMFFLKKRSFRWIYTIAAVLSIISLPLDGLWFSATTTAAFNTIATSDGLAKHAGASIWTIIWLIYVHRSQRVRDTFVN